MANRVLAYATDAEPTVHESGQEYMEGMWESVTIERSAAGQPGLMIVMERHDGDLMEDQMVVSIKDGRRFLEHVIEWLAARGPESEARAWDAGCAAGHREAKSNVAERNPHRAGAQS